MCKFGFKASSLVSKDSDENVVIQSTRYSARITSN
jgi:hypothetical protein